MITLPFILYFPAASILVIYIVRYLYKRTQPSLANVAGPPPASFLLGNIPQLLSEDGYNFHAELGQKYGGIVKLHAICGGKQLYVFDHAAMQSILVKNEHIYNMPDAFLAANHLMFGPCLVSTSGMSIVLNVPDRSHKPLAGNRHRRARKIMNPVFSPSRLREILPILYNVAHQMSRTLVDNVASTNEVDIIPILGSISLEFVGQAGLGHSFATSDYDALEGLKQLLFAAKRMIVPMQTLPFLMKTLSSSLRRFLINFVPLPDLWLARDLVDMMDKNSRHILHLKRQTLAKDDGAQIGHGKDMMSVLMRANERGDPKERLLDEELVGQMNVIIFAATDTTSTTMSRCLHELAKHPELQVMLRKELIESSIHGDIDHDTLLALPLLDAVCRETLRMYPAAVTSSRQALADNFLPLSTPMSGLDNAIIKEVFVPAGTIVHVGISAANKDPKVWGPDAAEWKPLRWLEPLPQTVLDARIPGVFPKLMTFIGGPRGCIGFKFAEMSIKVQLAVLIKKFQFSLTEKDITWRLGVAEAPYVNGKQSLPLIVSAIDNGDE